MCILTLHNVQKKKIKYKNISILIILYLFRPNLLYFYRFEEGRFSYMYLLVVGIICNTKNYIKLYFVRLYVRSFVRFWLLFDSNTKNVTFIGSLVLFSFSFKWNDCRLIVYRTKEIKKKKCVCLIDICLTVNWLVAVNWQLLNESHVHYHYQLSQCQKWI